jgi:DNA-binding CsgD family transcriptional regulator
MLTKRQIECLSWVREGKSSTDIGTILGLSPRTVDAYIADACARLGVRTRMQAVIVATDKGLLSPSIP